MINVRRTGPMAFSVTIQDGGNSTHHDVTLSDADRKRLGGDAHAPETCVEAAFRFLLDREPKESILQRFDLMVIARYFPEFERELPSYLSKS